MILSISIHYGHIAESSILLIRKQGGLESADCRVTLRYV